ncbi:MAG TPA: pyridoxal phosphate-dependent aminotransferase [Polyangiaceae bacterium]
MFSGRSSFDLAPNALAQALVRARASSRPLLDLTESNPTRAGIPYPREAILEALARPEALRYEPVAFGLASAREAVARDLSAHGPAVEASRVVLTASTSEAYAFVFKLLCDPGDEVLVPVPSYPLFEHLARLEGVRAVPYRLAYDGVWHVDLDSVRAAATPRTRAIVGVSPNNPTGSYLKRDELAALAALGLPLVSDEVFARYPLREDPTRALSALEAGAAPLVFALGGLSKLAALPQMKLAWIAVGGAPAAVEGALGRLEVVADAFLSVGTPVQHAAPLLLASRTTAEDALRARARDNLAFARAATAGSAVSVLDVEGGWYAPLRLPRTRSEESWALSLLEEDAVHLHPGHFFDFPDEAYLVASLITPEDAFREGIRRTVARVDAAT